MQLICLSDLQNDYINPHECAKRVNRLIVRSLASRCSICPFPARLPLSTYLMCLCAASVATQYPGMGLHAAQALLFLVTGHYWLFLFDLPVLVIHIQRCRAPASFQRVSLLCVCNIAFAITYRSHHGEPLCARLRRNEGMLDVTELFKQVPEEKKQRRAPTWFPRPLRSARCVARPPQSVENLSRVLVALASVGSSS